jgi:hypothetical protein
MKGLEPALTACTADVAIQEITATPVNDKRSPRRLKLVDEMARVCPRRIEVLHSGDLCITSDSYAFGR